MTAPVSPGSCGQHLQIHQRNNGLKKAWSLWCLSKLQDVWFNYSTKSLPIVLKQEGSRKLLPLLGPQHTQLAAEHNDTVRSKSGYSAPFVKEDATKYTPKLSFFSLCAKRIYSLSVYLYTIKPAVLMTHQTSRVNMDISSELLTVLSHAL